MLRFAGGKVGISLPGFGSIEGNWLPDDDERKAAWELYIELVTRISVVELAPGDGLLREALSSLYSLFGTSRDILRKYGPSVGRRSDGSDVSFGYIAITVLNYILRPVLAHWHTLLLDYENLRDARSSSVEHENHWANAPALRAALNDVRLQMIEYADLLATVAEVPPLHGVA